MRSCNTNYPLFYTHSGDYSCLLQPSVLALAVIGCELKLMGSDWLTILITLQDKAQVHTPTIPIIITGYYRWMVLTCQCVGNTLHHTTLP